MEPAGRSEDHAQVEERFFSAAVGEDAWDKHAQFLFGSATTVGVLAGAFGVLGAPSGWGRVTLAGAVILTGASLAHATMARIPKWDSVNLAAQASSLRVLLKWRRRYLWLASIEFALALLLGAVSPLVSMATPPDRAQAAQLTHALVRDTLDVQLRGMELPEYALATLTVAGAGGATTVASARGVADSLGAVVVELRGLAMDSVSGPYWLVGSWSAGPGASSWTDTVVVMSVD